MAIKNQEVKRVIDKIKDSLTAPELQFLLNYFDSKEGSPIDDFIDYLWDELYRGK